MSPLFRRIVSRRPAQNSAGFRVRAVVMACMLAVLVPASVVAVGVAWAAPGNNNAPGPLSNQPLIQPPNLNAFLNGANATERATARAAAIALGKALLWDVQLGSDGQTACANCHFAAGTDARAQNTLHPGANKAFNVVSRATRAVIGPNGILTGNEFPFHQRLAPEFQTSKVIQDYDDAVGSQGVKLTQFGDIVLGQAVETGTPIFDPVFNLAGNNVRQVTGRNTPTYINAAYNFTIFTDGRANNVFNGVNPFGPADSNAKVLAVDPTTGKLVSEVVRMRFAALASQATGPPLSTSEMSYVGRTFPKIGKKMLSLRPLAQQGVAADDSVFGPMGIVDPSGLGLKMPEGSYENLIKAAFNSKYWSNTSQKITFTQQTVNGVTSSVPTFADGAPSGTSEFTQMEANFSLFFGLAIQLYEMTLIGDQTRFDQFQSGNLAAYTAEEARGLQLFLDSGCGACHAGTEFTGHSQAAIQGLTSPAQNPAVGRAIGVELQLRLGKSYVDEGIYNIGVRPTGEDPGRGGKTPPFDNRATPAFKDRTFPLSFTLLALLNKAGKLPAGLAEYVPPLPADPNVKRSDMVQGAFKVPSLRNVELTGPYFHNGSVGTLVQAMDFYLRGGNFPKANAKNLHPAIVELPNLQGNEADQRAIIAFLLTLTDERVRQESAPFDHPAIDVPAGDSLILVPAVGAGGRPAASLPPLGPYLGLNPFLDPFVP
jgi:cytochrome c peroxidase